MRPMRPAVSGDPWTLTDAEIRRLPRPGRYYPPTQPPTLAGDEMTDDEARAWEKYEAWRDSETAA